MLNVLSFFYTISCVHSSTDCYAIVPYSSERAAYRSWESHLPNRIDELTCTPSFAKHFVPADNKSSCSSILSFRRNESSVKYSHSVTNLPGNEYFFFICVCLFFYFIVNYMSRSVEQRRVGAAIYFQRTSSGTARCSLEPGNRSLPQSHWNGARLHSHHRRRSQRAMVVAARVPGRSQGSSRWPCRLNLRRDS